VSRAAACRTSRIDRAVVDDDDTHPRGDRLSKARQAPLQGLWPVSDRDDHSEALDELPGSHAGRGHAGGSGVGEPRSDEPGNKATRPRACRARRPRQEAVEDLGPGSGQAHQSARTGIEEHLTPPVALDGPVETKCRAGAWRSAQADMPPSAATLAPVTAPASALKRKQITAAISSGRIRRPRCCWPAKVSGEASP